MQNIADILTLSKVVPVLAFKSVDEAVQVSRTLFENGVKVLEITLRHETALDAIKAVAKDLPDAVVGAGTIVNSDLARQAYDAGATFGVSPGLTPALGETVQELNWPFLPGVASLSEAMKAEEQGFQHLKFFPAEISGGVGFLKAVGSVLPKLTFCPTGGITGATAAQYLALKNVACVGGSWLTERGKDGVIDLDMVKTRAESVVRDF